MNKIIDLHTHSTMSDGSCTPKEVVRLAYRNNIQALALTDHDSIEGNDEARKEAEKLGLDFLNGIEISSKYNDRIIHILGLGIDEKNEKFLRLYNRIKETREESIENIIKILNGNGIKIDKAVLLERCRKKYLDRYDIYNYFLDEGICQKPQEIWDRYLDPIPYGEEELMSAKEAMDAIKDAGGLSFLAHYNKRIGLGGLSNYEIEEHIIKLINWGLDGLEQYYSDFEEENITYAKYIINKYNLIPSGGTDFHGKYRKQVEIGFGKGNLNIPYSFYENIKKKLNINAQA